VIGLLLFSASLFWLSRVMTPGVSAWQIVLPVALLGVGSAGVWAPLATSATRNLPPQSAGAGAGIYNTTRQVGAVLGSASIAVLMESRLAHNLPAAAGGAPAGEGFSAGQLPAMIRPGFSDAMAQSLVLPALVLLIGLAAALMFTAPSHLKKQPAEPAQPADQTT